MTLQWMIWARQGRRRPTGFEKGGETRTGWLGGDDSVGTVREGRTGGAGRRPALPVTLPGTLLGTVLAICGEGVRWPS